MSNSPNLVALSLAAALAAGCSSASDDADNICRLAEEVTADPSLDPDLRRARLAREVDALDLTSDTRAAWGAIANAAPDHRYIMLQAGFAEQGVEGWECAPLRDFWVGAPEEIAPDVPVE